MIKRRVIFTLCFKDGVLFRTKRFVPDYRYTMNFIDGGADEIVAIDVGEDRSAFWAAVERINDQCFLPLTVGGRIGSASDVREALRCGADKVLIDRAARANPDIIPSIAGKFGCQVFVLGLTVPHPDPIGWVKTATKLGIGEVFIQSVERDGSLMGYDLPLLKSIVPATTVPVVIGSGCGTWEHMRAGFEAGADGCATSVIHHFAAESVGKAKAYLKEHGIHVR